MRQALIKYNTIDAGILTETDQGTYTFDYLSAYIERFPNQFITFQMPVSNLENFIFQKSVSLQTSYFHCN